MTAAVFLIAHRSTLEPCSRSSVLCFSSEPSECIPFFFCHDWIKINNYLFSFIALQIIWIMRGLVTVPAEVKNLFLAAWHCAVYCIASIPTHCKPSYHHHFPHL